MKGFILTGLAAGLFASTAAAELPYYRDFVDPCYPARYEWTSHELVNAWMAPQVENGHVLDQTVWNAYFVPGTDRLTVGGMERLAYLARRRPCPDPVVYLQTAQDVPVAFDPEHPSRWVDARVRLDGGRIEVVHRYLQAYTAGRGEAFTVLLHDPQPVGMNGVEAGVSLLKMHLAPEGVLVIYGGIHSGGH